MIPLTIPAIAYQSDVPLLGNAPSRSYQGIFHSMNRATIIQQVVKPAVNIAHGFR